MADQSTSADELVSELVTVAVQYSPFEAASFQAEVNNELAAYREERNQFRERVSEREDTGLAYQGPKVVIPERFLARPEVFIVFETFVRSFVDPITVAAEIPRLLNRAARRRQDR